MTTPLTTRILGVALKGLHQHYKPHITINTFASDQDIVGRQTRGERLGMPTEPTMGAYCLTLSIPPGNDQNFAKFDRNAGSGQLH